MNAANIVVKALDKLQQNNTGRAARKQKQIAESMHADKQSTVTTYSTDGTAVALSTETVIKECIAETEGNIKQSSTDSASSNAETITLTYNGETLTAEDADMVLSQDFSDIACTILDAVIVEANKNNLGEVVIPKRLMCAVCGYRPEKYADFTKALDKAVAFIEDIKFEYQKTDASGAVTEEGNYYLIYDTYENDSYLVLNYIKDMLDDNMSESVKTAWTVFTDYVDEKSLVDMTAEDGDGDNSAAVEAGDAVVGKIEE